jgi:hypothetical protein
MNKVNHINLGLVTLLGIRYVNPVTYEHVTQYWISDENGRQYWCEKYEIVDTIAVSIVENAKNPVKGV